MDILTVSFTIIATLAEAPSYALRNLGGSCSFFFGSLLLATQVL